MMKYLKNLCVGKRVVFTLFATFTGYTGCHLWGGAHQTFLNTQSSDF